MPSPAQPALIRRNPAAAIDAGAVRALEEARHHDPFAVLGLHAVAGAKELRVWRPHAVEVRIGESRAPAARIGAGGLFVCVDRTAFVHAHPQVHWIDAQGGEHADVDPYTFGPQLADFDLHLFGEGRHHHAHRLLGAHPRRIDGVDGVLFATWAPNAERVSVVGEFNGWDGRCHPLRVRGASGVWELFVPGVAPDALYKFELRARRDGSLHLKADPYARRAELRPGTASIVAADTPFAWQDADWLARRAATDWQHAPLAIYEVHLGSWQRAADGGFLDYHELAPQLADHALALGFTHIELLPLTEHPLDESWGYQSTGYFAPTARFGTPEGLRFFVDHCHRRGLGVLLDWVPAHFPRDDWGLARFDGGPLYEHPDPRRGEHRDWGTLIHDFGRNEVRNLLLASANYWLEEFHFDGLRVDAVASMLYLDYSRQPGDWTPNAHGGRENLDAVAFLRELNALLHGAHPGCLTIAEESTAWPLVTAPVHAGGLGFSMKWNMGWMHDTLGYLARDPIHRRHHHDALTFGLLYAFSERFVLPFSHDEVVHGKGSMIGKMRGDAWQRHASLRLLYLYQWSYPGAKLLFMGSEFAQQREWAQSRALDWELQQQPLNAGVQALVGDLNRAYREEPALHGDCYGAQGFRWIDCEDAAHSVISYLRRHRGRFCVVVLNFTPQPRRGYRVGVPAAARYHERLNTDSRFYGGSDIGNAGALQPQALPWSGQPCSLLLDLPPLGGFILFPDETP